MVLLLHDAKIPVRKDITINSKRKFSFFPENPCSVVVGMQEEEKCLGRKRRRLIVAYQDGKRLATMKIQYPESANKMAFLEPNRMTTKGAPSDEIVRERYSTASEVDPRPSICVQTATAQQQQKASLLSYNRKCRLHTQFRILPNATRVFLFLSSFSSSSF
jgi:hypothetical protein